MKRRISLLVILLITFLMLFPSGSAEELTEPIELIDLHVKAKQLNGRASPRKSASIEALFEKGDILQCTGEWSPDYRWVEVKGGETGTVWVKITYVSENKETFLVTNEDYHQVKVRKRPVQGRVTAYIPKGKTIEITQVVLGWGKCSKGWVDLRYFVEVN